VTRLPVLADRLVEVTVDGKPVKVREGATLLDACKAAGVSTPTLCFAENLTPVNVCRVCVVELTGSRTLVPSCSRKAEAGMVVATDTERVRASRKVVLELLASSVDVSTAPAFAGYLERYGADPQRFGPRAEPAAAGERAAATPGPHHAASASSVTSASRLAAPTRRTRSRSPSPAAASTHASRRSTRCRCPTVRACTAATASASARRAR
jgi:ferredoxin